MSSSSSSQNHSKTEQQPSDILESRVDDTVGAPVEGAGPSDLGFSAPIEQNEIGVLGPYRIVRELGRGGMGAVYGAIDTRLDRPIALKVMLPKYAADKPAKERFLREARTTARIKHDNVVTVYEADEKNGVPYIAMEFLEGYPLNEYLKKKGNLSLNQVMRIVAEASAGLAAAHKIGLVHRDIKPGNLWLEAPNGRVKVLDFGLAKPIHAEVELTQSGAIVGTPAYMSPEQARGGKVDHRTDLFSIGVLLYRLCTGKLPFEGPNTMAVLMALGTEEPTPVQEINPTVPDALAQLTHQLLGKKPETRPQTADEVVKRLRAIMQGQTQAIPSVQPLGTQVTYAPLQVTAIPEANPFANLEDSSVTRIEQHNEPSSKSPPPSGPTPKGKPDSKPKKKKQGKGLLIAVLGFSALLMIALGVIIIKIINKDGTTTEIKVPDDSKIEINGKTVTTNPKKTDPKIEPKKVDPVELNADRRAAKFVLDNGGGIWINGNHNMGGIWIRNMPEGDFRLTGIQIAKKELTANDFRIFADCKNITAIAIAGTPIGDEGIAHFQNSPGIRELHLQGTTITDKGLAQFQKRKDLIGLSLHENKVTEEGIAAFAGETELEYLFLWGAFATDRSLPAFMKCTKLKGVVLRANKVTDAGLAFLKESPRIEDLEIGGIESTQEVVKHVISQPNLSKLVLGMSDKVTAGDFQNVEVNPRLIHLNLLGVKSDAVDMILAGCKNSRLRYLELTYSAITPKGLQQPQIISRLYTLNLNGTNIGSESVEFLKKGVSLTTLQITKTKFTEADAKELAKALPNCKIIHESGVYDPYFTPEDLKAIETTFQLGMKVGIIWPPANVQNMAALPKVGQPIGLNFTGSKSITDNQLTLIQKTRNIRSIGLVNTDISDAGIQHLKGLPLYRVYLDDSKKLTDASIASLYDCHLLTHLHLTGCNITDKAFAGAFNWPDLEWLYLRGTQITDKSLPAIKPCIMLTHLDLGETKVTDAGLAELAERRFLTRLLLDNTTITDAGLEKLAGLVGLKELNVSKTKVTEKGVRDLAAKLPNCTITFDGGVIKPLTDAEREALANSKAAEFVISKGGPVRVEGSEVEIWAVGDLPKVAFRVRELNLGGKAEITDADIALFKECGGLVKLILSDTKLTNTGLAHLKNCRNLDLIELSGTSITDEGLIHLKDCTRLQHFYANRTQLTGESFVHLKSFKNLVHLHLSQTKVNDISLANLKEFDKLTTIYLGLTPITDKGLVHLKDIPQLNLLGLEGANVTDEGLIHLKNTRIQILTLVNTKITDAGLTHLKDCKELKHLDVTKTKVTEKGAKELGNALPRCKIVYDGGMIEPKVVAGSDRKAAELVIKLKGTIKTSLGNDWVGQVPQGDFKLVGLNLARIPRPQDADFLIFAGCQHLQEINLERIPWTDDDFITAFSQCNDLRVAYIYDVPVGAKSLALLAKQPRLENLLLEQVPFQPKDLLLFQQSTSIKRLDLSKTNTDDEGVVAFKNCTKLEELYLSVTKVNGSFFKEFKNLDELKVLQLNSSRLNPNNLTIIPPMPKLEHFSLTDTHGGKANANFKVGRKLKIMNLPGTDNTDEVLKALLVSPNLEYISMWINGEVTFTDAGFARFKDLPFLKYLELNNIPLTDARLETIKGCYSLQKLKLVNPNLSKTKLAELAKSLPGCTIESTEKGVVSQIEPVWGGDNERKIAEHVVKQGGVCGLLPEGAFPNVTKLADIPQKPFGIWAIEIPGGKLVGKLDLTPYRNSVSLRRLAIGGCPLMDDDLVNLSGCRVLESIDFSATKITAKGLEHLKDCRRLKKIGLLQVKLGGELGVIKNWPHLEFAHLGYTDITDADVAQLKACPDLAEVLINDNPALTDKALEVFEGNKVLTQINIRNTAITDNGLLKLYGCSGLRIIELKGTKTTLEGVKKLAKQLPQCQIFHDQIEIQPRKPLTQAEHMKNAHVLIAASANLQIQPSGGDFFQAFNPKQIFPLEKTEFKVLRAHFGEKAVFSPEVIEALVQTHELKAINASGTVLPANLLETLSTLPDLEELILDRTNLDDKSVETLKKFKGLKLLKVSGTKITETGAKAIAVAIPNCTITYEGGMIEPKK